MTSVKVVKTVALLSFNKPLPIHLSPTPFLVPYILFRKRHVFHSNTRVCSYSILKGSHLKGRERPQMHKKRQTKITFNEANYAVQNVWFLVSCRYPTLPHNYLSTLLLQFALLLLCFTLRTCLSNALLSPPIHILLVQVLIRLKDEWPFEMKGLLSYVTFTSLYIFLCIVICGGRGEQFLQRIIVSQF